MSNKNALSMIQKIGFGGLSKQEILTKLRPVIEILLFGVVSRKKIYDQCKVDEIRSDVYLHLWQLIIRDKIDFARDPHQLLVFLMMDVTLTVGRFFQKKIRSTEEVDPNMPESACCITEAECFSDTMIVMLNIKQEIAMWTRYYQQALQKALTERLQLMIKRRAIYRAYLSYKEAQNAC